MKPKILMVNEGSVANTGFSTIGMAILSRLYNSNEYDVAELACYIEPEDPRLMNIPWPVYAATPNRGDKSGWHKYNSNTLAQFGEHIFDNVCVNFRPDVVLTIRDWWMDSWIDKSAFRNYFRWIWKPTVDGRPQKPEWLDTYSRVDTLIPITEWAKEVLSEEGWNIPMYPQAARPAVDENIFKPLDNKAALRDKYGVPKDARVLMTVMRNQGRKLYPDLFEAFHAFLQKDVDKTKDCYLIVHSSFPDGGWDFGKLLNSIPIGNRVLFTHICRSCGHVTCAPFSGARSHCHVCSNYSRTQPNAINGVSQKQLCEIYNCADLYVQYAIAEGLGMPSVEAKACGLPALITDNSASSEQAHDPGGIPLKMQRKFYDTVKETEQIRHYPDNNDLTNKLWKHMVCQFDQLPKLGLEARQAAMGYTFDRAYKIFDDAIKKTLTFPKWDWYSNNRVIKVNNEVPSGLKDIDFVNWLIQHKLQIRPELINSMWAQKIASCLDVGFEVHKGMQKPVSMESVYHMFQNMMMKWSMFDEERIGKKEKIAFSYLK